MSADAAVTDQVTRPTPRVAMVGFLALLVYGAGANIGSGTVLFLAAGMAVGALWSAVTFLRRVGDVRVTIAPTAQHDEGRVAVATTVVVPRGVIGVIGTHAAMSSDDEWQLLAAIGRDEPRCVDCERPRHWTPIPPAGSTAQVRVPAVLGRGPAQQIRIALDLSDAMGLVRRRLTLVGPVVDVVPAHGAAAAFNASTVEDEAEDRVSHALTANGAPGSELRPWRAGEPIRAVHWAASERANQLLIRPRSPETTQQRTLGVEDRAWIRTELDARCRDVAATADRLVSAGVQVEVAAGGRTLVWGRDARLLLASLTPHAGEAAGSEDDSRSPNPGMSQPRSRTRTTAAGSEDDSRSPNPGMSQPRSRTRTTAAGSEDDSRSPI